MYHGDLTTHRHSTLKWPRQKKPPKSSWTLWRLAVDTVWSQHQTIIPPLGEWISKPHQHWAWSYDRISNILFHVSQEGIITSHRQVMRSERRSRSFFDGRGEQCMVLPITAAPVIPSVTPTLLNCNDGYLTFKTKRYKLSAQSNSRSRMK